MTPEKCLKMLNLLKVTPFGLAETSRGMVGRCMPNSGHGGPTGTPFMTILRFYVSTHIPNIEKFQIYEVYKSREVSHFFSHQISRRMAP